MIPDLNQRILPEEPTPLEAETPVIPRTPPS